MFRTGARRGRKAQGARLKAMDLKVKLEALYKKYNRRKFVRPDPLEFLYKYPKSREREIVGLIASSLAYGRVAQILKSVSKVLDKMGDSPYEYLKKKSDREIMKDFLGFKHRFTTGCDKAGLLIGMKHAIKRHGSLEGCFRAGYKRDDETFMPTLSYFVAEISRCAGCAKLNLLPPPELGSACKRLNLYLRWMVRKDNVDPGGWDDLPSSKLIVPLDTHMYKIGRGFGFTKRRQANLKTALDITKGFADILPKDPVKYDFALTRFGIRSELNIGSVLKFVRRQLKQDC